MSAGKVAATAVAFTSLAGWLCLAFGRGRFWQASLDTHRNDARSSGTSIRRVEAVVPARNEAETIGACITTLAAQRYAGPFAITLVDDASADGTALVAAAAVAQLPQRSRLAVVPARPLQAPWTGKLNALGAGIQFACNERGAPDYWLFTDADIAHDPDNVAELVAKAERDDLALVSLMVQLRTQSAWERLLVPAFIFFFRKLYPFAWSNDPRRSTAAAAGGCMLVRGDALERIGGLEAIADRLIDDCALAAAIKGSGGKTWLGLSARTISLRRYETLSAFWTMVKRTAFVQLDRSYSRTALAAFTMGLLYVAPPVLSGLGVVCGEPRLAVTALAAWIAMTLLYAPTLRAYGRPAREVFLLPIAAVLYTAMTIDSAFAHARGRGGAWKGRTYVPRSSLIASETMLPEKLPA